MKRAVVFLASTLGLILTLPLLASSADIPLSGLTETNGTVSVGAPAPLLTGTDIKGVAITPETFKGRPVLVDFSSLFCVSCQQTIKEFARLEKVYKSTDLALVVVLDSMSRPKAMENVIGNLGATYTFIRDEGGKLFDGYGVTTIPFQVFIDRQGIVRKLHTGFAPEFETIFGLKELAGLGAAGKP